MRTIEFTISGQHITSSAISDLVGNTKNYVKASFTFSQSSEWDGLFKVAIFTANSKQYPAIIENGACMIPNIALTGEYVDVGVVAGADGTVLTTDTTRVRIEESVRVKPPFDMIEMYKELIDKMEDIEDDEADIDAALALKQPITLETPLVIDGETKTTVEDALAALNARSVDFDTELSSTSTNAVQNRVLKGIIDLLQTKALTNSLTIGGVEYTTVEGALGALLGVIPTVDAALDDTSTHAIQNKAVADALALKQPKTLDTPVTIGGVSKTTVEAALIAIAAALENQQTIDTQLDTTSEHAVQNKAIAAGINERQPKTLDTPITVNGTQYTTIESVIGAINTLLSNHIAAQVATSGGVHDFRKDPNSNDLQYYDETSQAWITISTGGGGGTITVDSALSLASVNPVQNKVLTAYMYDYLQTKDLTSSITIGGQTITTVEGALSALLSVIPTIDASLDGTSTNAIQNKAVKDALDLKQPKTLDTAITVDGTSQTTVETALAAINTLAAGNKTHSGASILSQAGVHNLRYYLNKLQGYDTSLAAWFDITTGGGGADEDRLDKIDQNILALALALAVYQQAEVVGTADNIVVEIFDDTTGYIIVKGAFDSTNHRLYA